MKKRNWSIPVLLIFLFCPTLYSRAVSNTLTTDTIVPISNGLVLEDIGKNYEVNPAKVPSYLFFTNSNTGGTTSVRRINGPNLVWKTQGYYQRNRELGQTFYIPEGDSIQLDAIVLRTGNSAKAVLSRAPGAEMQMQIFEVLGEPVINDNGTPQGTPSTHGFNTNHRTDDFLEGITYKTLALIRGGVFPDIPPTSQNGGQPGHLRYIRWDLQNEAEMVLKGGKRYAFMVGFESNGPGKGFSLGNDNQAASGAAPALRKDANGISWWSMRREGDGTLPPTQYPGENPPTDEFIRLQLIGESLFEDEHECKLSPTTDGFPDVDTYRTVEFYIEVVNNCPVVGTSCNDQDDNTENDQEDGNCNCYGTPIDGCTANGFLNYQRYNNIGSGRNIADLKTHPNFPDNPSQEIELTIFEGPTNIGNNYGARISGYICAPISGAYTFWIAGDDNVELNLSTDTKPANARRIAYHEDWTGPRVWDKFPTQQSEPIILQAGQSYYVEALVKESGGGDNLAVGWRLPTGIFQRPIPAAHLSTVADCKDAGTACDDNNPNTINDAEDGNCNCVGMNTCPLSGTPCDDNNPNTENDVEDGNCQCAGETIFIPGLQLVDLGTDYQRDPAITPDYLFFSGADLGGSTSVRRVDSPNLKWKTSGYYQRNRDLGQTFYVPEDTSITLDAIVLRTGNSASAIKRGALAAKVYLQVFEVIGSPTINDNNTPQGTNSTHGFTSNHRADDFIEGITYQSLLLASGGYFPVIGPTTENGGQRGHLNYIRWDLLGDNELTLSGGKRYAFMVGFREPALDRGFTLGNVNRAADPAAPKLLQDANGKEWWSMRREGSGILPPTQYPGSNPPNDPEVVAQLKKESLFANAHQYSLSPTTDGFPDVDTYRTIEFYLELKPAVVSAREQWILDQPLRIFPNPAGQTFRLGFFQDGPATEAELIIRDVQGRTLQKQTIWAQAGENTVNIIRDASWSNGLLQLFLLKDNKWQIGQVVLF